LFALILYLLAVIALIGSWANDRQKTVAALIKAWKAFDTILPQLLGVLVLIGVLLAYLDAPTIGRILGKDSGWWGVLVAAVVGSVTLIPGFVAFPTAAMLLKNGAGLTQIAAFISTLMMVGVATMPVEIKYFGKKVAVYRNLTAFVFSFVVAWVIGMVVR